MRGPLPLIAVIVLALGTTTCSSSADNKPVDAAADTSSATDGGADRMGDTGADGEEDCEKTGCTGDLECQQCLGQDGEPVFVCIPPESAC